MDMGEVEGAARKWAPEQPYAAKLPARKQSGGEAGRPRADATLVATGATGVEEPREEEGDWENCGGTGPWAEAKPAAENLGNPGSKRLEISEDEMKMNGAPEVIYAPP